MIDLCLSAMFLVTALLAQDQGRPSFRSGVGLVPIDVSVLDGKRQPIAGLQASDFTVLEDGKPRPVRVFEAVELPSMTAGLAAATEDGAAATVATNQIGDQDGRLVFILMDRTIPFGQPTIAARNIATAAVRALGPSDLAAIATTSGRVPQTLTGDRARLIRVINSADWSVLPTPEQDERVALSGGSYDLYGDARCLCGLCVLETITNLADVARDAPGRRKLLLFIGSSIVVQSEVRSALAEIGCDARIAKANEEMTAALRKSHLTVYSIDPSGLSTNMYRGSGNGREGGDAFMRRQQSANDSNQRMRDQGNLEVLPALTGGRAFVSSNTPETAVPEVFRESSVYYVLAYEPSPGGAPDKPRRIEVKVARKDARVMTTRAIQPGQPSTVVTRSGQPSRSTLDLALGGLLPQARAPLEMSAAAFAARDGQKAYVTVILNAPALENPQGVDVALLVQDQRGQHVASVRDGGVAVQPSGDLRTHVMLPPGDYEIRAAVQRRDNGVAASVFSQLTVPGFAESPLSMSDVIVGTRDNPNPPPNAAAPDFPIIGTTGRSFRRAEDVWAFAQVYQGTQKTDALQPIQVRMMVINASGRMVRDESMMFGVDTFVRRHAGVRLRLPVAGLDPGGYVLRLEAVRGSRTAARAVAFAVER